MSRARCSRPVLFVLLLAAFGAAASFGQEQNIDPNPVSLSNVLPSTPVQVVVVYTTSNPVQETTGVGVRTHWNSSQLTFDTRTNIFPTSVTGCPGATADTMDFDSDPLTDMYVACAWADLNPDDDFDGTPGEPGELWPAGPTNLYTMNFTTTAGFTGTTVRFSFSGSAACCTPQSDPFPITGVATPTPSNTPSITPTPSDTPTPSITPTPSDTPTPSNTPTASNTPTNTSTPSNTPTPSITPSAVVPEIPTLSGRGMALMVLLLLGIAAVYLARQRS
jgi:hypothetical protein